MPNILLGVTGSVAAIRTPDIYQLLKRAGHQVKVVATTASLYFFDSAALDGTGGKRNPNVVSLDEDEWPGRDKGKRWQRDDSVLHIELRRWADVLLIAPLDANTLAKLANGLGDNCLTCVWRAWDPARPVVLAPAMNTLMWEHRLTTQHLLAIAQTAGLPPHSALASAGPESVVKWINETAARLRIVPPESKRLACGDVGVGALAAPEEIVATVTGLSLRGSPAQTMS
jgi:phosphopantothenoylcysteine decarboxylase